MKKLILIALLVSYFAASSAQVITGTIIDKSSNEKVAGASVYFNGTTVGTYSDQDGNFQIKAIKNSTLPLSVNALGYNPVTLEDFITSEPLTIYLTPKVFNLNEVVVSGKSLAGRRKGNLRLFESVFLGTTSNGRSCRILNEEDISFNYDSDKDTLKAYALKPIQIENRALGYMIIYFLDKFEYDRRTDDFFFTGNMIFNEDLADKEAFSHSFEQKRLNAYRGSKMHFFRELWADHLYNSGFNLEDVNGESLDYRMIVTEDDNHKKYLFFNGSIIVLYNSITVMTKIKFPGGRVEFDSTGYFDGKRIKWEGQMVIQRVGDLLPYDYRPNGQLVSENLPDQSYSSLPDSLNIIEKVYLHIDRKSYFPGDDIWFKAYLIDVNTNLLTNHSGNLHVELISPSDEIISSRIIKLAGGTGNGDFSLPANAVTGNYRVRAYTNYMRNYSDQLFFNKELNIVGSASTTKSTSKPAAEKQKVLKVDFFPEGGSFIDSVNSIVAFKAVDGSGKGCDMSGTVYSSDGKKITDFLSTHLGMGSFNLTPEAGLTYYSITKGPDGTEIRSELPKSFHGGISLNASLTQNNELSLVFSTNSRTFNQIKDQNIKLSITKHDELEKVLYLKLNTLSDELTLPVDDLPEGILMITIFTQEDLPVSERLIFISHGQHPEIKIQHDKSEYKKREAVTLNISVDGDSLNPETAFLSLSAAEANFTDDPEEYTTNIASWFLLESDIRGVIEGPSYYFDTENSDRFKNLDLLLRTQGWRDFAWKYDSTGYFKPENGFYFSGMVSKNKRNKPLTGSQIHFLLYQDEGMVSDILKTDGFARFNSDNFAITGNARLTLNAIDRSGRSNGVILLDQVENKTPAITPFTASFPALKSRIQMKTIEKAKVLNIQDKDEILSKEYEAMESIKKKYKLSDTIRLGEVFVTAERRKELEVARIESIRAIYGGKPDNELIVTPQMTNVAAVPELLTAIPGVYVTGNLIDGYSVYLFRYMYLRERHNDPRYQPMLIIDGVQRPIEYMQSLPVDAIDRIDVLKEPAKTSVFGMEGANGVISIITKMGGNRAASSNDVKHSFHTTIKGYDSPRIFYSPYYSPEMPPGNPDLRKTLFWKSDIVLQTNNDLKIKYCNADNSGTIRITVEGVTSSGIPVTASTNYQVK